MVLVLLALVCCPIFVFCRNTWRWPFFTAASGLATSEPGVREAKTQAEETCTKPEFVFYGREMPRYVDSAFSPFLLYTVCSTLPGCYKITTVFSHAQTVVVCVSCSTVLCQPTGGRARLTEGGCSNSCTALLFLTTLFYRMFISKKTSLTFV